MTWITWRQHFEQNRRRPLPALDGPSGVPDELRAPLLRSLAVFQLGEAGEGRIATEIDRLRTPAIDDDYRAALKLFVAEEGRHARILGGIIRGLGGELLEDTWTERLFQAGRRLAGVRLKLVVLLAAEVVGMTFYEALASRLEPGSVRAALEEIAADETHHLAFHAAFFAAEATTPARQLAFAGIWRAVASAACATVLIDHAATLRAFGIPPGELAARLAQRVEEAAAAAGALALRPAPALAP